MYISEDLSHLTSGLLAAGSILSAGINVVVSVLVQ